jgi:hypothetical protein
MTKASDNDRLMQALELLSGRRPAKRADIGELFLAELQARRRRLQAWLRIINAEAGGLPFGQGAAARRCRATRTIRRSAAAAQ